MIKQILQDLNIVKKTAVQASAARPAADSTGRVEPVTEHIVQKHGGLITISPFITRHTAFRAVEPAAEHDHAADDTAPATTILAPTYDISRRMLQDIRAKLSERVIRPIVRVREINPKTDPCGYSLISVDIISHKGELNRIQITTAQMIYAELDEAAAKGIIGKINHAKTRMNYMVEGGIGHILFEAYKTKANNWKFAADLSARYYHHFRSAAPDFTEHKALERDIALFRHQHPRLFGHHHP